MFDFEQFQDLVEIDGTSKPAVKTLIAARVVPLLADFPYFVQRMSFEEMERVEGLMRSFQTYESPLLLNAYVELYRQQLEAPESTEKKRRVEFCAKLLAPLSEQTVLSNTTDHFSTIYKTH